MHRFHRAGASQQVATIIPAADPGRPGWPIGYSASWPGQAGSRPGGLGGPHAALADVVRRLDPGVGGEEEHVVFAVAAELQRVTTRREQ